MRKTVLTAVCIALAGSFIAGCGSPTVTTYMKQSSSEVLFLQFSSEGESVDGSLTLDTFADSTDTSVTDVRIPFTGNENGGLLTLNLGSSGAASGVVGTVFGSVANGVLTIALPQTNGTLENDVMHSSTQGDYDQAVQGMNVTACTNSNVINSTSTIC